MEPMFVNATFKKFFRSVKFELFINYWNSVDKPARL